MTKRNRRRGGNRAQDVDQEATHHNHNNRRNNIQTGLRFEAHAPTDNQKYRSAGFDPFVKQWPQYQPRQDRHQHQTTYAQIHRRLEDECLLLKSQRLKKSLLHHLTQALTEVERWDTEDKLGNDDMDWQPESEVVIPQIDRDVLYSYEKPASSPASSGHNDSRDAKLAFIFWDAKDTDCDVGRNKTASRLSSGPVHTLYSWGPLDHDISTSANGCGATVKDCAKGMETVANPNPVFSCARQD